jgi:hypothetical protein
LEDERSFGSQTSIEFGCCNYDKDYDTTASSSDELQDKPIEVKKAMCKTLKETGQCDLDSRCSYAHNLEEMLKQPQNMRTEPCPSYHRRLGCMLGRECSFMHSDSSLADIVGQ